MNYSKSLFAGFFLFCIQASYSMENQNFDTDQSSKKSTIHLTDLPPEILLHLVQCNMFQKPEPEVASDFPDKLFDSFGVGLVNYPDFGTGMTIFGSKICQGDHGAVENLLIGGADVDGADSYGDTPLIVAARWSHPEIVEKLLKAGANVDKQNKMGITALMLASQNGNAKIVTQLLKAGADISKKDNFEATARGFALSWLHDDIIKLLETGKSKSKNK